MFYNLVIITFTYLLNKVNGFQPWPFPQMTTARYPHILELCVVPPGGKAPRSFDNFQIHIIKCQPDETCVSEPDTQIMGMNLGYKSE